MDPLKRISAEALADRLITEARRTREAHEEQRRLEEERLRQERRERYRRYHEQLMAARPRIARIQPAATIYNNQGEDLPDEEF